MKNYNKLLNSLLEKATFVSYSSSDPNQVYTIMFSGCKTKMNIVSNKTDFFNIEFNNEPKSDFNNKNVNLSNLSISIHDEFIKNLIDKYQHLLNGSLTDKSIDKSFLDYLKNPAFIDQFLTSTEKNIRSVIKINENLRFSTDELYDSRGDFKNQLYPLKTKIISNSNVYTVVIPKYEFSKYPILNYLSAEIITEDPMDVISHISDKKFISIFEDSYLLTSVDNKNKKIDTKKTKV